MIAKISATENLGGALGYNFKKMENGEASILLAAELYQSNDGNYTMEDVLADMQALIPKKAERRRRCSIVRLIRTRMKNYPMKRLCRLPRSIWKHSAMATNPISRLQAQRYRP